MSLFLELHFVFDCIIFGFLIAGASLILALLYFILIPALHLSFSIVNIFSLWISP